jgi:light-regulated signal transduction histidine kinase (bacteriophytochrome)
MVPAQRALDIALANLRMTIAETGAEIVHDELPGVMADPTQLSQLFQNLIGNALKFRGECPPKISVTVERLADAWKFSVCDNGIGIEPQYFERIFFVFQRLHTRREYPGTGIGLSLCKKIVERHGGQIWLESEPGQGSKFHFTLPIRN